VRFAGASRHGVRIGEDASFVLHRSGTIRGAIRGLDPLPSWIAIEARIPDPTVPSRASFSRSAAAKADRYEILDLDAGRYEVRAMLADGRRSQPVEVQLAEGEVADGVDVSFGGAGIHGKVVDSDLRAVAGAEVQWVKLDSDDLPIDSTIRRTTTDAEGLFAFRDVEGGQYAFAASDATHAPAVGHRAVTASIEPSPLVLKLTEGGTVAGSVLDAEDGTPIVGAHVAAILQSERFPLVAVTDSEGRFRIRAPAGTFAVTAILGNGQPAAGETCEVQERAETSVVLRLRRGT
jgi:hypothetical protein